MTRALFSGLLPLLALGCSTNPIAPSPLVPTAIVGTVAAHSTARLGAAAPTTGRMLVTLQAGAPAILLTADGEACAPSCTVRVTQGDWVPMVVTNREDQAADYTVRIATGQ